MTEKQLFLNLLQLKATGFYCNLEIKFLLYKVVEFFFFFFFLLRTTEPNSCFLLELKKMSVSKETGDIVNCATTIKYFVHFPVWSSH